MFDGEGERGVRAVSDGGVGGLHCCADNGATLSPGSWRPDAPGNANVAACRALCARTAGCTHFSHSAAPQECADDLGKESRGFGRCGLCGACTQRERHARGPWQRSFISYEVARAAAPDDDQAAAAATIVLAAVRSLSSTSTPRIGPLLTAR